jgi:hypothetical protein
LGDVAGNPLFREDGAGRSVAWRTVSALPGAAGGTSKPTDDAGGGALRTSGEASSSAATGTGCVPAASLDSDSGAEAASSLKPDCSPFDLPAFGVD